MTRPMPCRAIGCDIPAHTRGFCPRHYQRRRVSGQFGYIPADATHRHMGLLRARGWTLRAIADAAGLWEQVIVRQALGQPRIRRDFAAAILAIDPVWQDTTRVSVPSCGFRRRVQALAWMGWPARVVAQRAGLTWPTFRAAAWSRPTTSASTAVAVARVYEVLSHLAGPSSRTAARARSRGYAPPAAWDDDTIDNPNARPQGLRRAS